MLTYGIVIASNIKADQRAVSKAGNFFLYFTRILHTSIESSTHASYMRIVLLKINSCTVGTEGPQWLETEVI